MKVILTILLMWTRFDTGPLSECPPPNIQEECRVGDIFFICDNLCGDGVSRLGWFTPTGYTWIIPGYGFEVADRDFDGDTDLRDVAHILNGQ